MKKAKAAAWQLTASLLIGVFFGFLLGSAAPDFHLKIEFGAPKKISSERERIIFGDANSELTAQIFIDWECPFSRQFWLETLPQIENMKFELVHLPLAGHENSEPAARAIECAAEQNSAESFATEILSDQTSWNFKETAEKLKLDVEDFENCFESRESKEKIENDRTLTRKLGISSSPTFLLENIRIEGSQPLASYMSAIKKFRGENLESFEDFLENSAR